MWRGTESWQICIYYNGHHSLLEPSEARASSFPDGYEAVLLLQLWLKEFDGESRRRQSLLVLSGRQQFRSLSMSSSILNHDDWIGWQWGCETAVVALILTLFLLSHLDQCAHASFELKWYNTATFLIKDDPFDAIILISNMFYCNDCIVLKTIIILYIVT